MPLGRVLVGAALAAVVAWWVVGTDADGERDLGDVALVGGDAIHRPVVPRRDAPLIEIVAAPEPVRLDVACSDADAAPSGGRVATVVDAFGAPIAGAELVRLECHTRWVSKTCMFDRVLATSDAGGVISLRGVERGDTCLVRAVDHQPLLVELDLRTRSPRWTLERGAELTLRVVDTSGTPVDGALVTWLPEGVDVWASPWPAGEAVGERTGSMPALRRVDDGLVIVALSTGADGRVRFSGLDDAGGRVLVEIEGRPRHAAGDVALVVGEQTDLGDVVIPGATFLRGRVTDTGGSPAEDITVKVHGSGYAAAVHAKTRSDGAFTAGPLRADVPTVAVGVEDKRRVGRRLSSFEVRQQAVAEPLDVALEPLLTMNVALVDAETGAPITTSFSIEPIGAPPHALHAPSVFLAMWGHADAQGRATLHQIDRVIDGLAVEVDGYAREQFALVETPPGLPLTVALDPTVSFSLRVADAVTGAPVGGATLRVDRRVEGSDTLSGSEGATIQRSGDGLFTVDWPRARTTGAFAIRASADGYLPARVDVVGLPVGDPDPFTVELEPRPPR